MPVPEHGSQDVVETVLVHFWESALRRRPIGRNDNFFALGGHSLTAMRIASRLRTIFGVQVTYAVVLEFLTVAALAQGLRNCDIPASELERAGREYLRQHGLDAPDLDPDSVGGGASA